MKYSPKKAFISGAFLLFVLFIFSACNKGVESEQEKPDLTFSFDQAAVALLSPADVHLEPGGRFESRYSGNISYLQYQHEHFAPFMLEAFASRHYSPGKLLERMWDGEYAGKWLDAATRTAVSTGDQAQLDLVDSFVDSLLKYQQNDGYLGIKLPTDRDLSSWEKDWDNWNLWNALNGLLTHFELRGSQQSLEAASAIGLWIVETYGPLTKSSDSFLKGEIIDAFTNVVVIGQLVRLYTHTGDQDFLEFVQQVIRHYPPIQEMMSSGEPYLIHPYMLSAVLGGMVAYASETKNQEILQTVEKVWESLSSDHLFPTGSLGERENLADNPIQDVPGGQIQETCATTEWIFLNMLLFEKTGKERYIAALEKTSYNALLAAQSADGYKWCYWTPLRYSKDWFHGPTRCCYWSCPRAIARIPQLIYASREDIIYVNMFESSRAMLPVGEDQVLVFQESEFPENGLSKLTLETPEGWGGTLRVRVPEWTSEYRISLNGSMIPGQANIEGYLDITLVDHIEHQVLIEFDIPLILES